MKDAEPIISQLSKTIISPVTVPNEMKMADTVS
jgi:hypothetical protein